MLQRTSCAVAVADGLFVTTELPPLFRSEFSCHCHSPHSRPTTWAKIKHCNWTTGDSSQQIVILPSSAVLQPVSSQICSSSKLHCDRRQESPVTQKQANFPLQTTHSLWCVRHLTNVTERNEAKQHLSTKTGKPQQWYACNKLIFWGDLSYW